MKNGYYNIEKIMFYDINNINLNNYLKLYIKNKNITLKNKKYKNKTKKYINANK